MKNFIKSIISAAALVVLASAPLAASAYSIGVTDELDSSILSGHVTESASSSSSQKGEEWSSSTAVKVGQANDSSGTSGTVVDPAQSGTSINGNYGEAVTTTTGSAGTYSQNSKTNMNMTGAQQVNTTLAGTVSTFSNP